VVLPTVGDRVLVTAGHRAGDERPPTLV
jgi:hypothetical protein